MMSPKLEGRYCRRGLMLAAVTLILSWAGQPVAAQDGRARHEAYVRGTGVANGQTPAARWLDPVCPRVIGLRETAARSAEAHIRLLAGRAGARLAPEPCNSNLVVTFTSDAAGLAREVYRLEPTQLAELSGNRREAVLRGSAPIRWWYATEVRGRDGEGERQPGTSGQGIADNHGGMNGSYDFQGDTMQYDSSLISTMMHRAIVSASVVVDLRQVEGKPLNTIAAFAALVGLAEIRNADYAPDGSILGLFASSHPPAGMTRQDISFLHALYELPLDRQASRHRGALISAMAEESDQP